MERSRSRIQFGSGSLAYFVVTALILIAAVYTQANLLFWAFGLVAGALVVSLLVTGVSLRGIEVHRLAPTRGVAGEPLVLRYHLVNRSRLALFSVEIIETWGKGRRGWRRCGPFAEHPPRLKGRPFGWVLHLGPNQSVQAEAPCWPVRRGALEFERVIVRSSFPFGILNKAIEFTQAGQTLIYPPLRRLNRQTALSLSNTQVISNKHADRGGGMDEFFGLRPYRPGDSYRLIDWKHSARGSDLVSREMTRPRTPRMMVLLDLRGEAQDTSDPAQPPGDGWLDAQEEAINLTGSLIREAYLHGIHVGLAVAGADSPVLPMHNSLAHRQRLLDSLARLTPDPTSSASQPLPAPPTVVVRPQWPPPPNRPGPSASITYLGRGDRASRHTPGEADKSARRGGAPVGAAHT